jgi:hypothetical protein
MSLMREHGPGRRFGPIKSLVAEKTMLPMLGDHAGKQDRLRKSCGYANRRMKKRITPMPCSSTGMIRQDQREPPLSFNTCNIAPG